MTIEGWSPPKKSNLILRWERAEPWLKAALAYDARNIPIDTIRDGFFGGHHGLLEGAESAILCEMTNLNGFRFLHIYLAGGKMAELVSVVLPGLESVAAWYGCAAAVVTGRRGWVRVLRSVGYAFVCRNSLGTGLFPNRLSDQPLRTMLNQ